MYIVLTIRATYPMSSSWCKPTKWAIWALRMAETCRSAHLKITTWAIPSRGWLTLPCNKNAHIEWLLKNIQNIVGCNKCHNCPFKRLAPEIQWHLKCRLENVIIWLWTMYMITNWSLNHNAICVNDFVNTSKYV